LERLGGLQRCFDAGGGERGQQRAGDGLVDLYPADAHAPAAAVLDQDPAGAVVARAFLAAAAVGFHVPVATAPGADRDSLQQGAPLADRTAGLVRARACVAGDPLAVFLVGGLVDVAGVVVPDQHAPFCLREPTHPLAGVAVLIDIALAAGLPERVR